MLFEYHYCSLDPEKKGCRPGTKKVCEHLKGLKTGHGVTCPHIEYRKEEGNVGSN